MSMQVTRRQALWAMNGLALSVTLGHLPAWAQGRKAYGPGVSDTEIVLGQTMPYSGPASSLGVVGKVQEAYFKMINDQGGVNSRKIRLISLDDGYSPPRTLEQTRRLVEQDQVTLIFSTVGTPTNAVIQKYLNTKKVPQLFISGAGSRFYDPKNSPWTLSSANSLQLEGRLHAKYLLREKPAAKIAVLYQNDDFGKDYLNGLTEGLGDKASRMLVASASYEITDPTVDSQVITLKGSGADVLMYYCSPKGASQAIRKTDELGWKPLRILASASRAISTVLVPAGLDKSVGLLSMSRFRDIEDPAVQQDPDVKEYLEFMRKYYPAGHATDVLESYAYFAAHLLTQTLKLAGDDLTRENIMKVATNLKKLPAPFLLPGATISTAPTDYELTEKVSFIRFDGKRWVLIGEPLVR